MKFTLEEHKLFPYIAWVTIIGFTVFVVHMTLSLNDRLERLEERVYQHNALEKTLEQY